MYVAIYISILFKQLTRFFCSVNQFLIMSKFEQPFIWCDNQNNMFDRPIHIIIQNLKCNSPYTVYAFTTIDNGNKFESLAHYVSNDKGSIDLKKVPSLSGSFTGVEPMGLLWSMKPSSFNKHQHARLVKVDVINPLIVTINLYDDILNLEEIQKLNVLQINALTGIRINQRMMTPGTQTIPLIFEKDGIYGTIFVPNGKGPFPGVIVLYGGFPGTLDYKAALLASYGFATLALSYVGLPGLPGLNAGTSLNLEYFEKATQVLLSHPKVDKNTGIGLIGISFSSFIVLMMGSFFPCIKCVIWLNGVYYPIFASVTYRGTIFPPQEISLQTENLNILRSELNVVLRQQYPKQVDPFCGDIDFSQIPFYNRHDVGYMFIAGLNDNNVPSEYYINQIEKLMKVSKHPNYQLLRYPGAGHLLEPCYGIHHRVTKSSNVFMDWGGETIPHCKAQEDSWKKQIEFLKLNLFVKEKSKL